MARRLRASILPTSNLLPVQSPQGVIVAPQA